MSRQYPLAGITPHGSRKEFVNPYRGRGQEEMKDTEYSAKLGDLCEKKVVSIWTGTINPEKEVLERIRELRKLVVGRIEPRLSNRMVYVQEYNSAISKSLTQTWREYEEMLSLLNYSTGTSLLQEAYELMNERPLNTDRFRYLFQASLILSGELVYPTFSSNPRENSRDSHIPEFLPGRIIPDVTYSLDGTYAGQFDAIVLPKDLEIDTSNFDFLSHLEKRLPWSVLEIKSQFRARRSTGGWKRSTPYKDDLDQFNHRLGGLVSDWEQRHNFPQVRDEKIPYNDPRYSLFPLPEGVIFCYLRGGSPTGVVRVDTKEVSYLSNWLRNVNYSIYPVDYDGGENEANLEDGELDRRIDESEINPGDMTYLHFPLQALVRFADDAYWDSVRTNEIKHPKKGVDSEIVSLSASQIKFNLEEE